MTTEQPCCPCMQVGLGCVVPVAGQCVWSLKVGTQKVHAVLCFHEVFIPPAARLPVLAQGAAGQDSAPWRG